MNYTFYTKKQKTKNRLIRIKIPSKIYKKIINKFVVIKIKKVEFLYKISNDQRFVIPQELKSKIKFLNKNRIMIKKIKKTSKRTNRLIVNKKINLLNIIPKKTRSGSDIKIIRKNNDLMCFFKSYNGKVRKVKIKKEVLLEFCRFLGYYQAEGGKHKIVNQGEGRRVVFTNTNLDLITDFIELSKHLIDIKMWNAEIKFQRRNKKNEKIIQRKLTNIGIQRKNIKIRVENRLKNCSVRFYICSTILSDIIIVFMNEIRKWLINKNISNKNCLEMYINFMQGLFAGDGNYSSYRNKYGGTHHRLIFYEEDKNYAIDYQKLLKNIGISSKIIKQRDKNLYLIRSTLNWNDLLKIQEFRLFNYHKKHKLSLKNSIKNHKRYKSHKYFIEINKNFNIQEICNISNRNKTTCYNWIKDMIRENLIVKNNINDWSLSSEGERIRNILKKID